jgi:RNA polymerase sigma-70 factor, ECF subfamily
LELFNRSEDMRQSIERIFGEHKGRLFAYLLRMSGKTDIAHDILQESVTRCMERYGDGEVSPSLLFTVARNAFIDHVRRNGRYAELDDDHPDTAAGQEHAVVTKDSFQHVLRGLQTLSGDERDILSMAAAGDLSYAEIAVVMSTSVANVKVKVHRARLKLKQYMEERNHE